MASSSSVDNRTAAKPDSREVPRMLELAKRLEAHGACIFGRLPGRCRYTDWAIDDWGSLLGPGKEIGFIPCDAGKENEDLCGKVGITTTPTLYVGGNMVRGYQRPDQIETLLREAPETADALASRSSIVYGRESCTWTKRQKQALGNSFSRVEYIDCEDKTLDAHGMSGAKKCATAGIAAVPAWSIEGSSPVYGYRRLSELTSLAKMEKPEIESHASASAALVSQGKAAVCMS